MNITRTLVAGAAAAGLFGLATLADAKGPPADKGNKNARARSRLVRPADAPDANAKGRIDVSTKRGDRSSLRVMGQNLAPGAPVTFVIEGQVFAEGAANDQGGVHVFLRTRRGDELPLDAESVADLEGDTIELFDGSRNRLLTGTVPSLDKSSLPRRFRGRAALAPETNATSRGRVRLLFRRRDCRSRLVIGAAGLVEGDAVSFRIADGEGTLTEVGTATANAEGTARYVARTDHGDPLPFDVATSLDLGGRAVAVYANDVLQLTGTLPGGD